MNSRKKIEDIRKIIVVGSISLGSSGLYAFLLAGVSRIVFGWKEEFCLVFIGLPSFLVLFVVHIALLPRYLRKAGLID
ncbi:hypothetical protein [Cupriavidus campinensis]|uniref:Uncharacterized protein n=1 Tax=Cupriavidus campinensis TaxID=151783 RepID=A0AAE9I346_9BURK|nr:hypothetical protein [Cupriavidus campinensis]URF06799.1 hypothetical protein M5D45_27380 [Cupriavidus campinensis]